MNVKNTNYRVVFHQIQVLPRIRLKLTNKCKAMSGYNLLAISTFQNFRFLRSESNKGY